MENHKIKLGTYIIATEKGFIPKNLSISWKTDSYLWLCELQKYLRDIYGIYVSSDHDLDPTGKFVIYYTNWGFINDPSSENYKYHPEGGYDEFNNWKTYEEALEFGLQEGLKLIKINKKYE